MQQETETVQLLEKIVSLDIIFHQKNEKKIVFLGLKKKKFLIHLLFKVKCPQMKKFCCFSIKKTLISKTRSFWKI